MRPGFGNTGNLPINVFLDGPRPTLLQQVSYQGNFTQSRDLPRYYFNPPRKNISAKPDVVLFPSATPNGLKARITLEEVDLPYKVENIQI